MLRPPSGPTEKPGFTALRLSAKDSHLKGLGHGFARWLKREIAQVPLLAGGSADSAKKMQWEVSEGFSPTIRPMLPQAAAPDLGANDSTQKRELDPLELSLSVALGGGQPGVLTPVGNTLHDASSGARPMVGGELALVEEVVRRISWGGDRRRGAARIELGGALVGTTIVVQGEGRTVALDIELGPGADAGTLPARLAARLAARGLEVRSVDVR